MNKGRSKLSVKIVLVLLLASGLSYAYATELTPQDKAQTIQVQEIVGDGESINKTIPAIEDPCSLTGGAADEARKLIKQYNIKPVDNNYMYKKAKAILGEIKTKKVDDKEHLATMLEISLCNWACQNNYKLHNVTSGTPYYFFKQGGKGIFVSMRMEGYYVSEGLRQGVAGLPLDMRGPMGDTYYLYVVVTKLNPEPNEKPNDSLKAEAQKVLDSVVVNSYVWGLDYYSTIVREAK